MRKLSASLLAALAACLITPAAISAESIIIKFSHVVAPDTPKGRAADKFKELANSYTNGKAKVEVYPNSQLYKDKEELEALQLGAVHMLAPSLAKFGPLGAKEFEVFDFPCIFPNYTGLHKVTQGSLGKQLLDKLDSKGIVG
ncbi:MAG TPA: C4-dicarboxylate ABC transporter, partial [Candidatus Competibacteraceae bacterium]|nr:C4-dicarboxylate ABC transporter [Candidatus Competibacteraceae bacterium]